MRRSDLGVYDFDDALFADNRGLFPKSSVCLIALQAADRVIAGNDYLADFATQHCSDVRVIPTCIDPEMYTPKVNYELHDRPRICWLGSPSTEKYLAGVAEPLAEVCHRTDAEVWVVSSGDGELGSLTPFVRRVEWTLGTQRDLGGIVDVAVGPLVEDSYSVGKCAYKLLQYGAMGLPFVGSPIRANETVIEKTGMVAARSDDEWVDGVSALLSITADRRKALGTAGREAVTVGYSYAAWENHWLAAVGFP